MTLTFERLNPINSFLWRLMALLLATGPSSLAQRAPAAPTTITGVVRDQAGIPVPGAVVSFHPGHFPAAANYAEVKTDSDGRFAMKIDYPPPRGGWRGSIHPTNVVIARSIERNLVAMAQFVPIPDTLNLVLQTGITFSGSVTDEAGAPIPAATAQMHILVGGYFKDLSPVPLKVDERGSWTFPAWPQGWYYDLKISAPGYGQDAAYLMQDKTGTNRLALPPFLLKRANLLLAGIVLNPEGKPQPGARVFFTGQGQPPSPTTTTTSAISDAAGRFSFDHVCAGTVQITAAAGGAATPPGSDVLPEMILHGRHGQAAQGGDTNVVLQLEYP